jgi:addiction module RelE/StbE family toxin
MKIVIREQVDADLDRIFEWIAEDSPRAATEIIRRIRQRIGRLATPGLEHMGRPGLDEGTRELVEPPYLIVYEVHEAQEEIEVLYIVHAAQNREGEF